MSRQSSQTKNTIEGHSPCNYPTFAPNCICALSVFLILATASADAGLIRGGGRSSAAAPVRTGLARCLLRTPVEDAYELYSPGLFELPAGFDPAVAFAGYAKYDCHFELAADEVFEFSGHAIGLPSIGDFMSFG